MQSFSKSSTRLSTTKALVASVVALIVCSNLALSQQPANERLTAASSRFAFKLYDQLRKQPTSQNTFVSPASVMMALAMTYNGADGETRQSMARALEIDGMSLEETNRAFADLKSALSPTDPKIQLKIANSLWIRNGFPVKPAFIARNEKNYAAEIATLNFDSPAATNTINSWVSKNTEGKIDKIVDRLMPDNVLLLINAIYFKGQWQFEFKKQNTKPDMFTVAGGEKKQVPMMSQSGTFFYYEGKDFQSVALPYGQGSVSMYIFLPDEQTSLDQFEQNLTSENWDTWMKSFAFKPGDLMLPRFKVEWELKLNEALKALGMADAFDPQRANFSQITPVSANNNLFISEVKHKSWGEVNEEGTVAAAATSVTGTLTSIQPPQQRFVMKVDRPFFFAIRDNRTGVLLFIGSVTNP